MSIVPKLIALMGATFFEYLIVGGGAGGGGGASGGAGRGGFGGQVLPGRDRARPGALSVTVGEGGVSQANGGASALAALSAAGGHTDAQSGAGVDGTASSISGSAVIYGSSGGEASGVVFPLNPGGAGAGQGGGIGDGQAAAVNRGGGGGGSFTGDGGRGGSGLVVVRYPTGVLTATGGSITTSGGYTIHTFTTDGTFTITS